MFRKRMGRSKNRISSSLGRPRSLVRYLVSSSSQKWMHGEGAGHSRRDRECSYLNMVWKKYKKTKKPARAGKLKLLLPSLR